MHFGYIYGFFVVGCLLIYTIMNFLSQVCSLICLLLNYTNMQEKNLEMYSTVSILGYGLLPIVTMSALAVVVPMT